MARRRNVEDGFDPDPPRGLPPDGPLTEALHNLAGGRSYSAGCDYYLNGSVVACEVTGCDVAGTVLGTETYGVTLTLGGDGEEIVAYDCDCPYCQDHGAFCKHCVALGLMYLRQRGTTGAATGPSLVERFQSLDKDALVEMLAEAARRDPELLLQIKRATTPQPATSDAKALRRTLEKALTLKRELGYYHVGEWLEEAQDALDALERFAPSSPSAAVDLAEFALERLNGSIENVQDDEGEAVDLLKTLAAIHRRACAEARLDGVEVAQRLYRLEMRDDWGVFDNARTDYDELLGTSGRDERRRLLQDDWERLPERRPGDRSEDSRVQQAMEAQVRAGGDIDALIRVLRKDLSSVGRFQRIAEQLQKAGRGDAALVWAEEGWAAFPKDRMALGGFLVERYVERERHDDALRVAWECFEAQPYPRPISWVKAAATAAGAWPEWRARIVERLRPAPNRRPNGHWDRGAESVVQFLMGEGDLDAAWAEAKAGDCPDSLWISLATRRAATHPDDSGAVVQGILERAIDRGNSDYSGQVELLLTLRPWLEPDAFTAYVAHLRTVFKRKRNFLRDLDARGL